MKKIGAFITAVILLIGCFGVSVFAGTDNKTVTLRIEGYDQTMYYDTISTSATTVEEVLEYVDSLDSTLTISMVDSAYGKYVSGVNGENESYFGGFDGWLFMVNGVNATGGISTVAVEDGDSIVLYYADTFGVGMQYPEVDSSQIEQGILIFTSEDTTYDASYNATVTTNPVEGATVTWTSGTQTTTYVTDADGKITISEEALTAGDHLIAISKEDVTGIPMVLAFAPDYTIHIDEDINAGDSSGIAIYIILMVAAGTLVMGIKQRMQNEK